MSEKELSCTRLTVGEEIPPLLQDRRSFIKTIAMGGLTLTVGGMVVRWTGAQPDGIEGPQYSMILVDFSKCTGCRICETVCAQYNHKALVDGEELWGLGNPYLANIRVHAFNPDADVPIACVMCPDNPCIQACPVQPDEEGRRALYRDPETLVITCNYDRCIGCGSCAQACQTQRAGAVLPNPQTNKPERMCTLCDGDPQCVKYCPYGALSHIVGDIDKAQYYGLSPEKIAEGLILQWYGLSITDVQEEQKSHNTPGTFQLMPNHPNPFNAQTTIPFTLPEPSFAEVGVYDLLGQKLRTLLKSEMASGIHRVVWDGRDQAGREAASGVYVVRLIVDRLGAQTRRMLLLR